ncbi:MAG: YggS family pyridoxal phosphate-dependent enzyme [Bacteroidetes bacterium]|nr:MAG: YggS family pyridoxal phosphate-dependent enzyme [Bacteroidota bacterium]
MESDSIRTRLIAIREDLPPNVTLVAVSKTKPIEDIESAYAEGQRDFGENRVAELVSKSEVLPKDIRWHAIGHLQTNKSKLITPISHLIHAVDSTRIYESLSKNNESSIDVLLQVHIAQETSKYGFTEDELLKILDSSSFEVNKDVFFNSDRIRIRGLMGMATFTDEKTLIASEFRGLRRFYEKIEKDMGPNFDTLSMGMSGDWRIAIDEGSTMIRVGSAIFGSR